jgi:hypothetical protein
VTREYERTCDDCGCVWHVPKGLAHPHMQGLPMSGRGGLAAMEAESVIEENAELSEQAAAFRRCPRCESDHYKQRSIRS